MEVGERVGNEGAGMATSVGWEKETSRLRHCMRPVRISGTLFCLLVLSAFFAPGTQSAWAQGPTTDAFSDVDEAVVPRGATSSTSFRPGHNLTLLAVGQQSSWSVARAGEVRSVEFDTWEPGAVLRYSFHLNLVRKFGLVLGTALGAWYQNRTVEGFRPGSSFMFPSIVAGVVQNFRADTRAILLAEYSANWYPWMTAQGAPTSSEPGDGRNTKVQLAPIPDAFSVLAQIDTFTGRSTAVSVALGWRVVSNELLGKPSKNTLLGNSSFRNSGLFAGAGLTWVLGDELER
jgi:hypothetical protein